MHRTTARFWKCLENLPSPVRKISKKNFELLKAIHTHLSILKKIGIFWSVRAGLNYRALAVEDGVDYIRVWIGTHDEYAKMIKEGGCKTIRVWMADRATSDLPVGLQEGGM